jgi:hypothetical protein
VAVLLEKRSFDVVPGFTELKVCAIILLTFALLQIEAAFDRMRCALSVVNPVYISLYQLLLHGISNRVRVAAC